MSIPIQSIRPDVIAAIDPGAGAAVPSSPGAFQNVLSDAVNRVQQLDLNSRQSIDRFLSGQGEDIHKTVLATQQSEMAFELFLQVRNKVISAYQEVMRMQL